MAVGSKLKGAFKSNPSLQRLSPGVYRNQQGQLVNQGGRRLPARFSQPQGSNLMQQAATDVGQQLGGFAGEAQLGANMGQQLSGAADQFQNGTDVGQQMGMATQFGDRSGQPLPGMTHPLDMSKYRDMMLRFPPGTNMQDVLGKFTGQPYTPQNPQQPIQQMPGQWQGPQMPQPSANNGGRYRLSPGVYGTKEQAMRQYNDQMTEMYKPAVMPSVPYKR